MARRINPDLVKERNNATFNVSKLTNLLDGGEKNTERRHRMRKLVEDDKELSGGPEYHFLSRPEQYENGIRKAAHVMKIAQKRNLTSKDDDYWEILRIAFPNEEVPFGLNESMFIPTLESQCSPEQAEKWIPRARRYDIIGTYAQTEMGHGTHIRGLETSSTYDPKTEEFVINSPTLSATKWWPGGLGKTSDHAVVMAQLYVHGKNLGVHPFIVQIRDLKTHNPMPGVIVGDIGPKLGYGSMDNGYVRFDNVRIPRENMLMKNSEVLRDGTYVSRAKNKRLVYGTMVYIRAMIAIGQAKYLAQCCIIAIRYSCVRRQMQLNPKEGEVQVLDYQTQQYKLLPTLATAYAFMFAGMQMRDTYYNMNQEIQKGNVDLLPELHAATSCLKAFTSYGASRGMEVCRMACGGHGYSHASGIPKIYVSGTPGCTYEGENTVLYLQTARYLSKTYTQKMSGQRTTGITSYLNLPEGRKSGITAELSLDSLLEAINFKAARLVERAGRSYNRLRATQEQHEAWNNSTVDFVAASQAHAEVYVVDAFIRAVSGVKDSALREVLTQLCQLYCCNSISENSSVLITTGYLNVDQFDIISDSVMTLMEKIRPNALALVDAFDYSDHQLGSILGRYDGNVYETMLEWAKASPLNKTEVHSSFEKYVKPFRAEMAKAKL